MKRARPVTGTDLSEIREAVRMLHIARGRLKGAGSVRAAAAVTGAIVAARGAERYARELVAAALRAEGAATVREREREARELAAWLTRGEDEDVARETHVHMGGSRANCSYCYYHPGAD